MVGKTIKINPAITPAIAIYDSPKFFMKSFLEQESHKEYKNNEQKYNGTHALTSNNLFPKLQQILNNSIAVNTIAKIFV